VKVSIIIPNYNGQHLLEKNLPLVIEAAQNHNDDAEVIVVDDASTDGSAQFLSKVFPGVRLFINEKNAGFARACSKGITASSYPLLFLLNTDVIPDKQSLPILAENFRQEDLFAVSPLMYDEHGNINPYSCNRPVLRKGRLSFAQQTEEFYRRAIDKKEIYPIFYATAGNSMFSKEKFLAMGGFDDLFYPFYCEDIDLGWMAWRRGWKSLFDPRTSVIHFSHGSISSSFKRRYVRKMNKRNNIIMMWKNLFPTHLFWKHHLRYMLFNLFYRTVALQFSYIVMYGQILKLLPGIRKSKYRERKARVLSNEWIFRIFELPQPYFHVDLGCGMNKRCADIGIDYSLNGTVADKKVNLGFEPLPLADNSVSLVTAYHLLEHIPKVIWTKEKEGFIPRFPFIYLMYEIWRILRPGGVFESMTHVLEPDLSQGSIYVTHINENTFKYFSGSEHPERNVSGGPMKCNFEIVRTEIVNDRKMRQKGVLHAFLRKPVL
jgi:GT2 family glycosyltransferase